MAAQIRYQSKGTKTQSLVNKKPTEETIYAPPHLQHQSLVLINCTSALTMNREMRAIKDRKHQYKADQYWIYY